MKNIYIKKDKIIIVHGTGWSDADLSRQYGSGNWQDIGFPPSTLLFPKYDGAKWSEDIDFKAQSEWAIRWQSYQDDKAERIRLSSYVSMQMISGGDAPNARQRLKTLNAKMTQEWQYLKDNLPKDCDLYTGERKGLDND